MKSVLKKIVLFLSVVSMLFVEIPAANVYAAVSMPKEQEIIETEYVDLSNEVLQEGGYLSNSSESGIMLLSLTQEARRAYLKEKLTEAWNSFAASCDVSGYGITAEDLAAVYTDTLNENYRFFYVAAGYSYSYQSADGTITNINISYTLTKDEAQKRLVLYEAAISDALRGADASWSDMEKALYINDYLARHCEYDTTYSKYTAYDALVNKTAVCQGYALAYQLLARELGLSCEIVTSQELNHAWDLVKIGSSYYHVDTTWNDPVSDRTGRARHYYFMKSSAYFNSSAGGHMASDWVISGGISQTAATNTSYDGYFWNSVDTGFEYVNGSWYGVSGSGISTYTCNGSTFTETGVLQSLDAIWPVWGSSTGYWTGSYASLASFNNKLYYSVSDAIYELNPSTKVSSVIYGLSDAQKAEGYIYGMRISANGTVGFLLAKSPNSGDDVGIYTAKVLATDISQCTITLGTASFTYNGTARQPSVTVKDGTTTLVKDTDYTVAYSNNINAGTATVTISGKGNYAGSVSKTFTISKAAQTLTVSASKSEITVADTSTITAKGTGTITYTSSNTSIATVSSAGVVKGVSAGTATITIKAAGDSNYNEKTETVTITVKNKETTLTNLSGCTVTLGTTSYTYNGTARQPSVTVKNGTTTLTKNTDYTVAYSNNINAGTATVTITGKGNYTGSVSKTFTISKASQNLTVSISSSSLIYGKTGQITASGTGTITYISSKMSVATVSSSGKVTAKGAGTATITVKAAGNSNYNAATKTITISVLYAAPVISSVTNSSAGVTVTWGKVTGAAKYRVYRKTGSGSWTKLGDTTGTSFTDKTAKSGTTYTYTIRCISSDAKSFTSSYNSGKSIRYVAAPVISSISNVNGGVQVKWGKVTGAVKYRVYRKTGSGSWTRLGDTTGTSFTDKTAKSGTTYTYTIRCISSDAKSFTSSYNSGKSIRYVAAPVISSISNVNGGVQVKWGKVTGAVKYRVYRKTGSGSWTRLGDTTGTSFTDKTAKSGTTYTYTIRCISSDAKSFTSSYNAGKSIRYVAAPVISSISNVNGGVQVKWGKVTGAVKYRVYRKTGSGSWTRVGDTTGTSFTDKTAKKGTTYTYTIRCISSDGKSFTSGYNATGKKITVK